MRKSETATLSLESSLPQHYSFQYQTSLSLNQNRLIPSSTVVHFNFRKAKASTRNTMEQDRILYGGLIARSPSYVEEDPQASKGRKAKKRKSQNEEDEASTGKRGRPRVDVKDQNAIEVGELRVLPLLPLLTKTRDGERRSVSPNEHTASEKSPPSTPSKSKSRNSKPSSTR